MSCEWGGWAVNYRLRGRGSGPLVNDSLLLIKLGQPPITIDVLTNPVPCRGQDQKFIHNDKCAVAVLDNDHSMSAISHS